MAPSFTIPPSPLLPTVPSPFSHHSPDHPSPLAESEVVSGQATPLPRRASFRSLLQVHSPEELQLLNQAELQPSLEHLRHDVSSLNRLFLFFFIILSLTLAAYTGQY